MKRSKKDRRLELECEESVSCYTCNKFNECSYTKRKSLECPLYLCIKSGKHYKDCYNCEYGK